MKTSLKILILTVALAAMVSCSTTRRAERLVRRAVALCPELVQTKAHPIDTVLAVPTYTDWAVVAFPQVLQGDTLFAATDHGTVAVSLCVADSTLSVGFVAAPQEIHYKDTVQYEQVTISPAQKRGGSFLSHFALALIGLFVGIGLCVWIYSILKK